MKVVSPAQMSAIDACAINEYGIPGILLMENAASAVVSEAVSMMGGCRNRIVTVVAGRGNNGGDAFAAARLLQCRGAEVCVHLTGSKDGISGDALFNMSLLEKIGIQVSELMSDADVEMLAGDIKKSHLVIDGIFGTGLSRDVGGIAGQVIGVINSSGKPVLSIDIPSGIDGTDGSIRGVCVRADVTVTFCMPKTGLVLSPGCEHAGRIVTADIGIPAGAVKKQDIRCEIIDMEMASRLIPERMSDSNKGDYGRVFIISGSTGMTGSGCLASMAALRSGAGLVYLGVPRSLAGIYGSAVAEPVILPLEDGGNGRLATESGQQIIAHMDRMDVVAVGPGLSASDPVGKVVEQVISNSRIPLVLDADALNAVSGNVEILKDLKTTAIITPHPGEMARLTGLNVGDVQKDRIGTAKKFSSEYGVITVLKGFRTIVALPDGSIFINPSGNAGMATAGTGDVLTGIIAGLAAQGLPAADAAVAGVFIHGLAGDAAAGELGMHGVTAGDVLRHLPLVIKEIAGMRKNSHAL